MGTVDMRGGYGMYTWFTDAARRRTRSDLKGDIQLVTVQDDDLDGVPDTVRGTLKGPPDVFRLPPGQAPGDDDYLTRAGHDPHRPRGAGGLVEVGDAAAVLRAGRVDRLAATCASTPCRGGMMPLDRHGALLREAAPARASRSTPRR